MSVYHVPPEAWVANLGNEGHAFALNLNDFCKAVGIGRTKAYEEIKAGRLEARKAGRRTLITAEAARAWLNALPRVTAEAAA